MRGPWESDLATEAKATRAFCSSCQGRELMPVTEMTEQNDCVVRWWCAQCSRFREWSVRKADYSQLPFDTVGIPRIPREARETLRGAITTADFDFLQGQLPKGRKPGPDGLPFELLGHSPADMKAVIVGCINSILTGEAPARTPRSWMGGLICFLLKKDSGRGPRHWGIPPSVPAGYGV